LEEHWEEEVAQVDVSPHHQAVSLAAKQDLQVLVPLVVLVAGEGAAGIVGVGVEVGEGEALPQK